MIDFSVHKILTSPSGDMQLKAEFHVKKNSLVTLYGKSGAGKTSILKMFAGLLNPKSGKIKVNDEVWFDSKKDINISPQKRKLGFVFQDYALFPNMTVKENLEFALIKNQNRKIIDELIDIIELGNLQNRKPKTLSGGQQQRVALARSLVQKPEILLLDEPLSALDNEMRIKLQDYILKVHKEYNLTTFLVSHDISEILKMSDNIIVMESGQITKQGSPSEIFDTGGFSGKFQFTGEVLSIEKHDFIFIVSILIGKDLVKVIADECEAESLKIGDKVLVASKAFNPVIKKLG